MVGLICDRCGKETEVPYRTLCRKCWNELNEELGYKFEPYITNADVIKHMSDEKLARLIGDNVDCCICKSMNEFDECPCDGVVGCEDIWLKWLRKEADGGKVQEM